jgi:hypothetical protein
MVPITGPFLQNYSAGVGVGSRWWSREVYRQLKPYDLPLPYTMASRGVGVDVGWGSEGNKTNTQRASNFGSYSPRRIEDLPSWFKTSVENQSRDRLMKTINSEALLLAALAEAKGSIHSMANHLDSMTRLFRDLPIPYLHAARRSSLLVKHGVATVRDVGKKFADRILEVYFGVMPIISDVQSCAETLSKDFKPFTAEGSAKRADGVYTKNFQTSNWHWERDEYWYKVKCGCTGKVNNPNAYLAQNMGLVNPFATLWELAPWSFVVDYVINVNQFIDSMTDLYGVDLYEPFQRITCGSFRETHHLDFVGPKNTGGYDTGIWYRGALAKRSLPAVRLGVRQFSLGKDLSRLVTSGALLLQAVVTRTR